MGSNIVFVYGCWDLRTVRTGHVVSVVCSICGCWRLI